MNMVTDFDEEPCISRFEVAPGRLVAGTSVLLVADCVASRPGARLQLSSAPSNYAIHPTSVPLNPGINLVRVRVFVHGPPGRLALTGRLEGVAREDTVLVEAAPRSQ